MDAIQNVVTFNYSARYYTLGNTKDPDEILYVLHGHGQLAGYFINKFSTIDNPRRLIVAPEGLNRYYLEGFTGRVGATWMTREDRLTDISNYQVFLTTVHETITKSLQPESIKVLGFSQGAATAARWVAHTEIQCDQLILWAGIFPPDLDLSSARSKLGSLDVITVYGEQDEYLNDSVTREHQGIMEKLNISSRVITFDGGHELEEVTLNQLF